MGIENLQAVMDEYLHHLRSAESTVVMDDKYLMALAKQAREALSIRPSGYEGLTRPRPTTRLLSPVGSHCATAAVAKTRRAPGSRRSATHSTAHSGRSSRPRPASARRASTSTDGVTRSCIGICRPTQLISNNAKDGLTASVATRYVATSPRPTAAS